MRNVAVCSTGWPTMPVRQTEVSSAVFERLAFGQRAEGIVAVARPPQTTLDDLRLPACPLVAVLEGVEKPGNVGAVLRSADAAGVSALIVADGGNRSLQPEHDPRQLGDDFQRAGLHGAGCRGPRLAREAGGSRFLPPESMRRPTTLQVDFTGPAAIVLGSEAAGLSAVWSARRNAHSPADARRGRQPERLRRPRPCCFTKRCGNVDCRNALRSSGRRRLRRPERQSLQSSLPAAGFAHDGQLS